LREATRVSQRLRKTGQPVPAEVREKAAEYRTRRKSGTFQKLTPAERGARRWPEAAARHDWSDEDVCRASVQEARLERKCLPVDSLTRRKARHNSRS
jgi:hypothetical protein